MLDPAEAEKVPEGQAHSCLFPMHLWVSLSLSPSPTLPLLQNEGSAWEQSLSFEQRLLFPGCGERLLDAQGQ